MSSFLGADLLLMWYQETYIKDTTDFIKKIEAIDHVSDYSYLVIADVRYLYTNIPHKKELKLLNKT